MTFRTLPSPGTRNGRIRREVESQLEALELSHFLTVLKNDSMNLIVWLCDVVRLLLSSSCECK
jgi:hypothetical protein